MKKILIVLTLISLISCGGSPVVVKLPIPSQPDYPKIQTKESKCLTDEVYEKFRKRDVLKDGHIDKLEGIIRSTH